MRSWKDNSLKAYYLLFTLIWLLAGAALIGLNFGFFGRYDLESFINSPSGTIVLYALGALAAVSGFYFFKKFIVLQRQSMSFDHQGELGKVQISSYAVQELAEEILREEIGLSSFGTNLAQLDGGILIDVRATVDSSEDIGALGKNIQRTLRDKIMERTGLAVEKVDFYAQGIRRNEGLGPRSMDSYDEVPSESEDSLEEEEGEQAPQEEEGEQIDEMEMEDEEEDEEEESLEERISLVNEGEEEETGREESEEEEKENEGREQ